MVGEVLFGLQTFNALLETVKGLQAINDKTARNLAIMDLTDKIISAKSDYAVLQERVGELEKELMRHEKWEAEKQRYRLTDFGGGTFAYALKEDMANGDPPHRLCARCYEEGHPSILQFDDRNGVGQDRYDCPRCKTGFAFGVRRERDLTVNRGGPRGPGSWMGR